MHFLFGGIGQFEDPESSFKHTPQFFVPSGFFFTWYPFSSTFVEHQGLYPVTWLKSYVHEWYVLLFKSNLKGNTQGWLKTAFLLTRNEYSADAFAVLQTLSSDVSVWRPIWNKIGTKKYKYLGGDLPIIYKQWFSIKFTVYLNSNFYRHISDTILVEMGSIRNNPQIQRNSLYTHSQYILYGHKFL